MISRTPANWVTLSLLITPVALFFGLGLYRYSTMAAVEKQLQIIRWFHHEHPLLTLALFGIADIAVAAFSIPIATFMTLVVHRG
jgi:hypothetical protein